MCICMISDVIESKKNILQHNYNSVNLYYCSFLYIIYLIVLVFKYLSNYKVNKVNNN